MLRSSRAAISFSFAGLSALASIAALPDVSHAQGDERVLFAEWTVPYPNNAGRPRDPHVAPDGSVFFVGQAGNYIARLDPATGNFRQYTIDAGTNPHNLIVDAQGMVWYAGNRNGMIGRLDPRSGEITRYPMPDPAARDPHTLIFDAQGNIWFTAQQSNFVGHLNTRTGAIRLVNTGPQTRPYGIVINSRGVPWFNLFGVPKIAKINPETMEITTYDLPNERARGRRIALTPDDVVWYTDYTRGFLGRVDPNTGAVTEVPMPGGPASLPYGMASDERGRLWVTESGPKGAILYGYDPRTNRFFGKTMVGREDNNTIRHMYYDRKTGMLWFGTDQGTVGRFDVGKSRTAM